MVLTHQLSKVEHGNSLLDHQTGLWMCQITVKEKTDKTRESTHSASPRVFPEPHLPFGLLILSPLPGGFVCLFGLPYLVRASGHLLTFVWINHLNCESKRVQFLKICVPTWTVAQTAFIWKEYIYLSRGGSKIEDGIQWDMWKWDLNTQHLPSGLVSFPWTTRLTSKIKDNK